MCVCWGGEAQRAKAVAQPAAPANTHVILHSPTVELTLLQNPKHMTLTERHRRSDGSPRRIAASPGALRPRPSRLAAVATAAARRTAGAGGGKARRRLGRRAAWAVARRGTGGGGGGGRRYAVGKVVGCGWVGARAGGARRRAGGRAGGARATHTPAATPADSREFGRAWRHASTQSSDGWQWHERRSCSPPLPPQRRRPSSPRHSPRRSATRRRIPTTRLSSLPGGAATSARRQPRRNHSCAMTRWASACTSPRASSVRAVGGAATQSR